PPVLQAVIATTPDHEALARASVRLTWDGVPGPLTPIDVSGYQPGDTLIVPLTVPVAETKTYDWTIDVVVEYGDHDANGDPIRPKAEASTSGETPVLADMLADWLGRETIGRGWGLSVADHLAFVCGGVLWVTGSGDWREFQNQPHSDEIYSDGQYISPPEDFGTLVQNA